VEGDDQQAPPGFEDGGRGGESGGERFEFFVHRHPDGLEGLGRRVGPTVAADGFFNAVRQIQGGDEGLDGAVPENRSGDPAGAGFLTVFEENPHDVRLRPLVHDVRRGARTGRPHAHVERALAHERKSALGGVELAGRNPEIHQQAVGPFPHPDLGDFLDA